MELKTKSRCITATASVLLLAGITQTPQVRHKDTHFLTIVNRYV